MSLTHYAQESHQAIESDDKQHLWWHLYLFDALLKDSCIHAFIIELLRSATSYLEVSPVIVQAFDEHDSEGVKHLLNMTFQGAFPSQVLSLGSLWRFDISVKLPLCLLIEKQILEANGKAVLKPGALCAWHSSSVGYFGGVWIGDNNHLVLF